MKPEQQAAALHVIRRTTELIRERQANPDPVLPLGQYAFGQLQATLEFLSQRCFTGDLADTISQLVAVMDQVY